jgi:hypothetical protein
MTTALPNGTLPADPRQAAGYYLGLGMAPIPLPPRSKDPGYADWQHLRLTADSLDDYFPNGQARNVGILNGEPSGNLLDVDLDCPEALTAAPLLLCETGWVFGRPSRPRSHWIYQTDPPLDTAQQKFKGLDGTTLLELRGTGGLTVYPPSTHDETGEPIRWERFTEPAEVPLIDLQRASGEVAAVAMLARYWPAKGSRDDAHMALSGGLLRGGVDAERAERIVRAVAVVTRDEQIRERSRKPERTAAKQQDGKYTTGWPTLARILGPDGEAVVTRVREWLGIASPKATLGGRKKSVVLLEPYKPFPVEVLP